MTNIPETSPQRTFDQLSPVEKCTAILGVVLEPIPEEAIYEWAGLIKENLPIEQRQSIDILLSEVTVSTVQDEKRYILPENKKSMLDGIDTNSVRRVVVAAIRNKIQAAREESLA